MQDLEIKTKIICYKRRTYLLENGTMLTAPLPSNVEGHFGPELKLFIITQSYSGNVSQNKIHQILTDLGVQISEGQINNILLEHAASLKKEYEDMAQAGIEVSKNLSTDDTGALHKKDNGYSLVILSELFTYFMTSDNKSRTNFLKALRVNHNDYVLDQNALKYIKSYKPPADFLIKIEPMLNIVCLDREAWQALLIQHNITSLNTGKVMLKVIEEAALLGSAIMHGLSEDCIILSDGARQFKILPDTHASCWVHAVRAIKKLIPKNEQEASEIEKIKKQVWDYYDKLKLYQKQNQHTSEDKKLLIDEFDTIFGQSVNNDNLAVVLATFRTNKEELLRVLEYPKTPLHNNASERDIRAAVIKRKISGGTRVDRGRKARDIFLSIFLTCRKLGISFWEFIGDRVRKTNRFPSLADIIRHKAKQAAAAP